jgi:hypothetical protein
MDAFGWGRAKAASTIATSAGMARSPMPLLEKVLWLLLRDLS